MTSKQTLYSSIILLLTFSIIVAEVPSKLNETVPTDLPRPDLPQDVKMMLQNSSLHVEEGDNSPMSENDIIFDQPDLTTSIETTSGTFQMEAFKSTNNDQIFRNEDKVQKASQLIWFSVGQPTFAKTKFRLDEVEKLFHFSVGGFNTYIQMMTLGQRRMLAVTVNRKYDVAVEDNQIVNLILSRLECKLNLYDEAGKKYLLKGAVTDFRNFPLRLDFEAPRNSPERILFEELLENAEDDADLYFLCNMESKDKTVQLQRAPFQREFGLYTRQFETSVPVLDQLKTQIKAELTTKFEQDMAAFKLSFKESQPRLERLPSQAVTRCRICFTTSLGCFISYDYACSGWSDAPSYSASFYPQEGITGGYCTVQWQLECEEGIVAGASGQI